MKRLRVRCPGIAELLKQDQPAFGLAMSLLVGKLTTRDSIGTCGKEVAFTPEGSRLEREQLQEVVLVLARAGAWGYRHKCTMADFGAIALGGAS